MLAGVICRKWATIICRSCCTGSGIPLHEVFRELKYTWMFSAPKCHFCGKVFCNTDTLQYHSSECHPDEIGKLTFSCRYCLKCFPTDLALQGHVESSYTGLQKYLCKWCGRRFRENYLPEHYRIDQHIPHECEFWGRFEHELHELQFIQLRVFFTAKNCTLLRTPLHCCCLIL